MTTLCLNQHVIFLFDIKQRKHIFNRLHGLSDGDLVPIFDRGPGRDFLKALRGIRYVLGRCSTIVFYTEK